MTRIKWKAEMDRATKREALRYCRSSMERDRFCDYLCTMVVVVQAVITQTMITGTIRRLCVSDIVVARFIICHQDKRRFSCSRTVST